MTYETAVQAWEGIAKSKQPVLKDKLVRSAVAYARVRTDSRLASSEERLDMDRHRAALHEAFIDDCNILSRTMLKAGEPAAWRQALGDERKEIGDFACWVHCFLGLAAR